MKPETVKRPRPIWQQRYSVIECVAIAMDFRRGGHSRFVTLWQGRHGAAASAAGTAEG